MRVLYAACVFACAGGLLAPWPGAAQSVYKSVGADGKVTYSDHPPAQGKVEKTLNFENLPVSTVPAETQTYVEQLRRMQASPTGQEPLPGGGKTPVLFTAAWCGYCKQAKAYLAQRGLAYQEVDVETPNGAKVFASAGGSKAIPLIVVGKKKLSGFSAEAYDAFLRAAAEAPAPSASAGRSG